MQSSPDSAPRVVSIIQSSFLPWKGYFDIIDQSDAFILLDNVQFTRRDWRSRNKIPTPAGEKWLTVPVQVKGKYDQLIQDVEISDGKWFRSHWGVIENAYRKAPYFKQYREFFRELFFSATQTRLSEINFHFISALCGELGIDTPLGWSSDYGVDSDDATERLALLCEAENADQYISGPAARDYLDESVFNRRGIGVRFFDYSHYREYPQLQEPFSHFVSIIDMLFMCGEDTMPMIREDRAAAGQG